MWMTLNYAMHIFLQTKSDPKYGQAAAIPTMKADFAKLERDFQL